MKLLRPLVAVMLLCWVLLASVAAMDMVVCFGADGHVTLEATRNGRCTALMSLAVPSKTAIPLSNADHCGPCIDMPLLTDNARERPLSMMATSVQLNMPVLAPATDIVTLPLALIPTPLRSASALVLSPTLMALRTIVLLI